MFTTASGYHALNFGHLLGEVVRRVTGKTLKSFVAEEIAGPLDADFQIGAKPSDAERIAPVVPPPPLPFDFASMDPTSPTVRTFTGPLVDATYANTAAWRAADIGAANGHANARSVVRVLSALSLANPRLLSAETIDSVFDVQADGIDLVLGVPLRFGIGYGLAKPETIPYIPDGRVCFWGGWGGSLILMDLERRVTLAYMMNRMSPGVIGSPRAETYLVAAYAAMGIDLRLEAALVRRGDRLAVTPRTQNPTRTLIGELPAGDDVGAGYHHALHAERSAVNPGRSSRQVETRVHRLRGHSRRVEDHEVGPAAGPEAPPVAEAVEGCGGASQVVDDLLHGYKAQLSGWFRQHCRRIVEGVDHVQVSTCVRSSDHGPRIAPHLYSPTPRLDVLPAVLVDDHCSQAVRYDDVRQRRPGSPTGTLGDLTEGEALIGLGLLREGLQQHVLPPVGYRTKRAVLALSQPVHLRPPGRVAQHRQLLGVR